MIFYQQNNDIQVEVRKFIKNERVYNDERSREAERNGEREKMPKVKRYRSNIIMTLELNQLPLFVKHEHIKNT